MLPAEWMAKAAAEGIRPRTQRVEHQVWEEALYLFSSDALPLLLLGSAWSADIKLVYLLYIHIIIYN